MILLIQLGASFRTKGTYQLTTPGAYTAYEGVKALKGLVS
jgi:hypothetical protein